MNNIPIRLWLAAHMLPKDRRPTADDLEHALWAADFLLKLSAEKPTTKPGENG